MFNNRGIWVFVLRKLIFILRVYDLWNLIVVKRGRILNYVVGKIMWFILYLVISGIVGL